MRPMSGALLSRDPRTDHYLRCCGMPAPRKHVTADDCIRSLREQNCKLELKLRSRNRDDFLADLRAMRRGRDMTQAQLAKKAGGKKTTIIAIERGRGEPR